MIRRLQLLVWTAAVVTACIPSAQSRPGISATPSGTPIASLAATPTPTPTRSTGQLAQHQEPSLPAAREELAETVVNRTLYVIAGFDAAGRDSSSVFTYAGSWSSGPSLPQALDHTAAAALLGRLYVAGGFAGGRASATTYRLAQGRWEQVGSLHHPRAAEALIPLDGLLYAVGGRDSSMGSVAPTEVYDPASGTWSDLPALPAPRHHVAGFVYAGMACVAGGKFPYTARVDCFDPAAAAWRRLPDLPQATSGAGAVVLGDDPVIVGGEGNAIVPWLFRFDGQAWRRLPMLLPRHGMQAALLGGRAWVCGGGTMAALHPTAICTSIGPTP